MAFFFLRQFKVTKLKGAKYLLFFLASNNKLLTLQSLAIVRRSLSSTRKSLNMLYSYVTLNLLQYLNVNRIESSMKFANQPNQNNQSQNRIIEIQKQKQKDLQLPNLLPSCIWTLHP